MKVRLSDNRKLHPNIWLQSVSVSKLSFILSYVEENQTRQVLDTELGFDSEAYRYWNIKIAQFHGGVKMTSSLEFNETENHSCAAHLAPKMETKISSTRFSCPIMTVANQVRLDMGVTLFVYTLYIYLFLRWRK